MILGKSCWSIAYSLVLAFLCVYAALTNYLVALVSLVGRIVLGRVVECGGCVCTLWRFIN